MIWFMRFQTFFTGSGTWVRRTGRPRGSRMVREVL